MANRLTRIYTRTGDAGETGLADGSRVAKDAPRVEAMGAIDELNSALGVLLSETMPDDLRACLTNVQNDLFDLGGELS
ncbi:MAG TPA: ATP:cob(I)alamin adenosyltransferase, partial [Burkholderiales bacterium]|nr:ATP:cob(I)alamin adenosyltransferase [Burkholderiales bacterium]